MPSDVTSPADAKSTAAATRFEDGLGVRIATTDAFGEPIEHLKLCADLAALDSAIRERVSRLINFRHVRYVRLRGAERLTNADKDFVVAYDAVPGLRVSELLDLTSHASLGVDIDVALQIVRELLPAVAVLHDSRNVTHGAIAPERLVLTSQGRLVIVDHGLGLALGKLGYSRRRLWQQLSVAVPPGTGKVMFDARADVIQIGMVALALILGRAIGRDEYPDDVRKLVGGARELTPKGEWRAMSSELQSWLERTLPTDHRQPYMTVREAQQAFETLVSNKRYAPSAAALKTIVTKYYSLIDAKGPGDVLSESEAAHAKTPAVSAATNGGAVSITSAVSARVSESVSESTSKRNEAPMTAKVAATVATPVIEAKAQQVAASPASTSATLAAPAAPTTSAAPAAPVALVAPTAPPATAVSAKTPAAPSKTSPAVAPTPTPPTTPPPAAAKTTTPAASPKTAAPPVAAPPVKVAVSKPAPASAPTPTPTPSKNTAEPIAAAPPTPPATAPVASPSLKVTPDETLLPQIAARPGRSARVSEPPPTFSSEPEAPVSTANGVEIGPIADSVTPSRRRPRRTLVMPIGDSMSREALSRSGKQTGIVSPPTPQTPKPFAPAPSVPVFAKAPVAAPPSPVASPVPAPPAAVVPTAVPVAKKPAVAPPPVVVTPPKPFVSEPLSEMEIDAPTIPSRSLIPAFVTASTPRVKAEPPKPVAPAVSVTPAKPATASGDEQMLEALRTLQQEDASEVRFDKDILIGRRHDNAEPMTLNPPQGALTESAAAQALAPTSDGLAAQPGELSAFEQVAEDTYQHAEVSLALKDLTPSSDSLDAPVAMPPMPETGGVRIVDAETILQMTAVDDATPLAANSISLDMPGIIEVQASRAANPKPAIQIQVIKPANARPAAPPMVAKTATPPPASAAPVPVAKVAAPDDEPVSFVAMPAPPPAPASMPASVDKAIIAKPPVAQPAAEKIAAERAAAQRAAAEKAAAERAAEKAAAEKAAAEKAAAQKAAAEKAAAEKAAVEKAAAERAAAEKAAAEKAAAQKAAAERAAAEKAAAERAAQQAAAEKAAAEKAAAERAAAEKAAADKAAAQKAAAEKAAAEKAAAERAAQKAAAEKAAAEKAAAERAAAEKAAAEKAATQKAAAEKAAAEKAAAQRAAAEKAAEKAAAEKAAAEKAAAERAAAEKVAAEKAATQKAAAEKAAAEKAAAERAAAEKAAAERAAAEKAAAERAAAQKAAAEKVAAEKRAAEKAAAEKKAAAPLAVTSPVVSKKDKAPVAAPPASVAPIEAPLDIVFEPAAEAIAPPVAAAVVTPTVAPVPPAAVTPAPVPVAPAASVPVMVVPIAAVPSASAPTSVPPVMVPPMVPVAPLPPAMQSFPAGASSSSLAASMNASNGGSTPKTKKSAAVAAFWNVEEAPQDAVLPAWARGVELNGGVPQDAAAPSLPSGPLGASAEPTSAYTALGPPVVPVSPTAPGSRLRMWLRRSKTGTSTGIGVATTTAAATDATRDLTGADAYKYVPTPGNGAASARSIESSSFNSNSMFVNAGGGLFGSATAEESATRYMPATQALPRARVNWRRTLAAAFVVSLLEGVAFATAYWYVAPTETGTLTIETTPPGIDVLVDGRVSGHTPFVGALPPGRHTIELRQGANSRVIPVEISGGVQTWQRITWSKGLKTGQAHVTSTAPNSRVTVDGKDMGVTPLTISTLSAGKHMVTVESSSGTVNTPMSVSPGETTELDVPVYPGWVSVLASVELQIFEGDHFLGTTESEKLLLSPGRHKLDFVSEPLGYKHSQSVMVTPGATAALSIVMPKVPVAIEGQAGTELFVDGEAAGKLPLKDLKLPLGMREIVFKLPDNTTRRQVAVITNGAPMRVIAAPAQ